MNRKRVRAWAVGSGWSSLALLGYLFLTLVMTWPLVIQFTTAIPGDSFDGWQNYWNQWWIKVALIDRLRHPFYTDLLYYPTGVGLYFHTLNPFNGVVTLPVQLSAGLIPAYNVVVLLSWSLGGYGVYLLVRWLLRGQGQGPAGQIAPFVAGVIFTFSPFHMAHLLGHMQVMSLEWIPFYLLYLLRSFEQQRAGQPWARSALLAGGFLTLVGLCDWYFVLYLFFFTGLCLLWALVQSSPRQWPLRLLPGLVAGTVMLVLLSPILLPMVREALQFSFMIRPTSDLYILSASLLDFLIPNRLHTLFRPESLSWPGNQIAPVSERTISIGYVALLLALIGVWRRRRGWGLWLLALLFFASLALGPRWHLGNITEADLPPAPLAHWTPFALLNAAVPFMRISRSVSRYALMVQLSVAVLAGMGLATLLRRRHGTPLTNWARGGLIGTLCLGVILFEDWVAPYPMSPPDTPAFYAQLQTMPDTGAVLNLPMNYDRPGYLLYQTVHQKPLAIAYISRDDPRTFTERVPLLQQLRHLGPDVLALDPLVVGPTVLTDLGIGIVVQDRYKMPGGLEREYTEAVANGLFADQPPLYADERITVHQVVAPTIPQPYLALGPLHWGPRLLVDEQPERALTGPAQLQLYHGTSVQELRLTYRTAPAVGIKITTLDGVPLVILPPAPDGTQATIAVASVPPMAGELGLVQSMLLTPDRAGEVWVRQIEVVQP